MSEIITLTEASKRTGVKRPSILNWIATGELEDIRTEKGFIGVKWPEFQEHPRVRAYRPHGTIKDLDISTTESGPVLVKANTVDSSYFTSPGKMKLKTPLHDTIRPPGASGSAFTHDEKDLIRTCVKFCIKRGVLFDYLKPFADSVLEKLEK